MPAASQAGSTAAGRAFDKASTCCATVGRPPAPGLAPGPECHAAWLVRKTCALARRGARSPAWPTLRRLGESHLAGRALLTRRSSLCYGGNAAGALRLNEAGDSCSTRRASPTCWRWRPAQPVVFEAASWAPQASIPATKPVCRLSFIWKRGLAGLRGSPGFSSHFAPSDPPASARSRSAVPVPRLLPLRPPAAEPSGGHGIAGRQQRRSRRAAAAWAAPAGSAYASRKTHRSPAP